MIEPHQKSRTGYRGAIAASIVGGVIVFALDQTLKLVAMTIQFEYRCVTRDFICFGLAQNDRSAFGLFAVGSFWFILIIPILLLVIDVVVLRFIAPPSSYFSVTLFSVGALSNWFDRLRLGYVVDYFGIRLPTVNLADYCIVTAVALLLYSVIRGRNQGPTR